MTTNYKKIKAMSIDEMAKHYTKLAKAMFIGANQVLKKDGIEIDYSKVESSTEDFKQWLEQESEEQ
jgi:hypothetical protein